MQLPQIFPAYLKGRDNATQEDASHYILADKYYRIQFLVFVVVIFGTPINSANPHGGRVVVFMRKEFDQPPN